MSLAQLEVVLLAKISDFQDGFKMASKSIDDFSKKIDRTAGKFKDTGAMLTKNLTVPILGVGAALIKLDDSFARAEGKIRTRTGAIGGDLKGLRNDFDSVFTSGPFGIDNTAIAISELNVGLKLTGRELQEVSTQFLKFSNITGINVGELIDTGARGMKGWQMDEGSKEEALSWYWKTGQTTGINQDKLLNQMSQYSDPLSTAGYTWKESSVLMGNLHQSGAADELILGSVRVAINKMAEAGVEDIGAGLSSAFRQIKEAASEGEAVSMAGNLFGARAGVDVARSVRRGDFDIAENYTNIENNPDTIDSAFEDSLTFLDKFKEKINELTLAMEPLGESLTQSLEVVFPVLERGVIAIEGMVDKFNSLDTATQENIIKFIGFVAVVGPIITVLGKIGGAIAVVVKAFGLLFGGIGKLIGGFKLLVTGAGIVGKGLAFLVSGPIGWTTAAIIALGIAITVMVLNWDKTKATVSKWANSVLGTMEDLKTKAVKTMGSIVKSLNELWNKGMDFIGKDEWKSDIDEITDNWDDKVNKSIAKSEEYANKVSEAQDKIDKINEDKAKKKNKKKGKDTEWNASEALTRVSLVSDAPITLSNRVTQVSESFKGLNTEIKKTPGNMEDIDKLMEEILKGSEKVEKVGKTQTDKTVQHVDKVGEYLKKLKDNFTSASDSIKSYIGYFDKFSRKDLRATPTFRLLNNAKLRDQAFGERESVLSSLENRGISQEILTDLSKMGMDKLGDLKGLSNMSDTQLQQWMQYQVGANSSAERQAITQVEKVEIVIQGADKNAEKITQEIFRKLKAKGVSI